MSITITQKKKISETIVDHAKIIQMNIDIISKRITYVVAFGVVDEKTGFSIVDRKTFLVSGKDFDSLTSLKGDSTKSLYDHIAEVSYNYLKTNNKLEYSFR